MYFIHHKIEIYNNNCFHGYFNGNNTTTNGTYVSFHDNSLVKLFSIDTEVASVKLFL